MNTDKWLREVAAYREHLSPNERREMLLWSWPVRRAITAAPPPMPWSWDASHYDEEILECGKRVSASLALLASDWYPFCGPRRIDGSAYDPTFIKRCSLIYDDLCELDKALPALDGFEVQEYLAELLETHWGDGDREGRCELLNYAFKQVEKKNWLSICRTLEQARDHAYLNVQTTNYLDNIARTRKHLTMLMKWLQEATDQVHFVESQLGKECFMEESSSAFLFNDAVCSFYDAFQIIIENNYKVQDFLKEVLQKELDHSGRNQREKVGRPKSVWVGDAHRHLAKLGMKAAERRALLRACALLRPEKD